MQIAHIAKSLGIKPGDEITVRVSNTKVVRRYVVRSSEYTIEATDSRMKCYWRRFVYWVKRVLGKEM